MIIHFKFLFNDIFKNNEKFNEIQLKYEVEQLYSNAVNQLDFNKITCNKCKEIGDFEIKGYYYRNIIINNISVRIRITRIRCRSCKRTHAILFLDFIPYYQLSSFNSNQLILKQFIDNEWDEQIIQRLKQRVKQFERRLKDIVMSVFTNTIEEITTSYNEYRREAYLQIHRGIVILFSSS